MPEEQVTVTSPPAGGAFGPNAWLVDDMFEEYRSDPSSVSESWREFFADYVPGGVAAIAVPSAPSIPAPEPAWGDGRPGSAPPAAPVAVGTGPGVADATATTSAAVVSGEGSDGGVSAATSTDGAQTTPSGTAASPLRGAAARIAQNMAASLSVPTATSVRSVPAKLLEVNRAILNQHLARTSGGKVSFTHLIGFAVVRALEAVPALNSSFVADVEGTGKPGVVHHDHVGLGLAVDLEKSDGTRTLLVPVIRAAETLDFRAFVIAYEDLVRKVHTAKATPDDFAGATVTLTNPGTLGTMQSVPRLMPGQGAIIGVGALGYPAEFQAADRRSLAEIGVGPVVTLTSTYDHRIIQGAESGLFLTYMTECLTGQHGFYESVFSAMDVPYQPVRWQADVNAGDSEHRRLVKQVHVQSLINMYRVRGHLIADLDPLSAEPRPLHPELDPTTYGLTLWDLDREFVVDGLAGRFTLTLGEALDILRDAYCRTLGIEYMHIQDPEQKRWIQQHTEGVPTTLEPVEQRHILDRLNAAEAFERFLHSRYVGQKRFGLEGAESTIVLLDAVLEEGVAAGTTVAVLGMAHRGRLNVLANIVGKSYGEIFREFEGDLDPDSVQGSGDVKYHKGATGKFVARSGSELSVTLASNPSHLEAVDPVVEGMVRAKQDMLSGDRCFDVLSVLVHGDAAFAGQGVVAETLELSQLSGYRTGGTVHVVVNNQLGFTTAPESARSSLYPTDVAKMVQAPVFHVNGDDPEACLRARAPCLRLPSGLPQGRGDRPGVLPPPRPQRGGRPQLHPAAHVRHHRRQALGPQALHRVPRASWRHHRGRSRTGSRGLPEPVAGGAGRDTPDRLPPAHHLAGAAGRPGVTPVEAGRAHGRGPRRARASGGPGRLGAPGLHRAPQAAPAVRAPGPDGGRRRGGLGARRDPRPGLDPARGHRCTAFGPGHQAGDLQPTPCRPRRLPHGGGVGAARPPRRRGHRALRSPRLAAVGVRGSGLRVRLLGGVARSPGGVGGAIRRLRQRCPDHHRQLLGVRRRQVGPALGSGAAAPARLRRSGPRALLGAHRAVSHPVRRGNMRLAQPTTAAQYFHLLRSQVRGMGRQPLVVFTPKSLLRARQSRSPLDDLAMGSFDEVLDDPATTETTTATTTVTITTADGGGEGGGAPGLSTPRRCAGCCCARARWPSTPWPGATRWPETRRGSPFPASTRPRWPWCASSSSTPGPRTALAAVLGRYPHADQVVWVQEEPENMGAWSFVHGRLHRLFRERFTLTHVSRAESASPATGSAALHLLEQEDLLRRAFS